jgi:hypothetical protein
MRKLASFLVLLLVTLSGYARIKTGSWQEYLSYASTHKVAEGDGKIFCASLGGLFFIDLQDYTINKITRLDGLSDAGIQTMSYHTPKEMLLIAYKNSNIDLVFRNRVINLSDIQRKQMTGDKTIHNISFIGNDAYLSCGFGIVVIDIDRREIKDTYIIGQDGSQVAVFDTETDGQRLYAATAKGLYSATVNSNLLDYNNWTQERNIPRQGAKFSHLTKLAGELLAVYTRDEWYGDEVYAYRNGQWVRAFYQTGFVKDITVSGNYLIATGREEVLIFDKNEQLAGRISNYVLNGRTVNPVNPQSAVLTSGGALYIADNTFGLIRQQGQSFDQYIPAGPLNNRVFDLSFTGQALWVSSGGRTDAWNNQFVAPVFQSLFSGEWGYYSAAEYPGMTGFFDIVQVAENPSDPGHIFAASWGGGILEFRDRQFVAKYNNLNSPLETAIPDQPTAPYTRIGGIAFDGDNTLWITNSQVAHNLHSLSGSGEWKTFLLPELSGSQTILGKILVTGDGDKWMIAPRGKDVYVVNKDVTQRKHLPVTSYFNNGQQEILNRMNDVYSIAEDLSGDIWIGTSKGVAVFSTPGRIWQSGNYYAYQPSLEMGDGLYHPLLETETITAIAVDGANRKWLGTKNSGLYLVSARGDQEILHFTSANSPLPSDNITSLALNQKSGELFIGTDDGLFSYQGDAPAGEDGFAGVYVYPNPVRESYDGPVVIKGLMKDSDVRITDISGNLVHKTRSLGSQVVWDGKNLRGNRVSTGVYLIFASDAKGDQSHIAKLLFIR